MTAAELLKALDGVPDEALSPMFKLGENAAVGAMVEWLVEGDHEPQIERVGVGVYCIEFFDRDMALIRRAPTLIEALAAAVRAAAKGTA